MTTQSRYRPSLWSLSPASILITSNNTSSSIPRLLEATPPDVGGSTWTFYILLAVLHEVPEHSSPPQKTYPLELEKPSLSSSGHSVTLQPCRRQSS